jgi:hypothetical protein
MISKTTRYLLLGLGVSLFMSAQEPTLSFGLKMGSGLGMASGNKEQASNLSLHLALTSQYRLDSKSSLIGEVKYVYFRAEDWENPSLPEEPAQIFYFSDGSPAWSSKYFGIDLRKNDLDGLVLNLGYRRAIGDTRWSWQAGVNIHWLKSYDQALGQINLYETEEACLDADDEDDFSNWTRLNSKNAVKPGIFAGVHGYIGNNVFVEANITTVAFDQAFFRPQVIAGKETVETYSRTKVVFEFSAGFRF